MSDAALVKLAAEAGLLVRWTDAIGRKHRVGNDTLRAILRALRFPADSREDIADSQARLGQERGGVRPLIVTRAGDSVRVPLSGPADLVLNTGERRSLRWRGPDGALVFRAPREPGYHRLESVGRVYQLAVAPSRCVRPGDIVKGRRLAGLSVQIYALPGGTSGAFGDFAALGGFARQSGRLGLDAIMVSPVHALFGAEPARFRPYSPSTRLFLNPLFADATLEGVPACENKPRAGGLIDWSRAGPGKRENLRAAFHKFRERGQTRDFETFCRRGGERLLAHALFEALDADFRSKGIKGFENWPHGFASPAALGVREFARAAREELEYQLFVQWLSERSAAAAQKSARVTMAIGTVSDIAVGMDPSGSHAWSAPDELLRGLHVGAPPDFFNPRGQDWGLTTLSPRVLERSGYAPFIATLRAGMRHAGGIRIDHALGMRRIWVLPAGASPSEGAYLRYPQCELLRLIALESHLHRAIVIGEDLGTVPDGFRQDLHAAGILGMQVLWFERDGAGRYTPPAKWRRHAIATTTTHDLPTVAGWWSEHDIDCQERAGRLRDKKERLRRERAADREQLWSAFTRAKCARGGAPAREAPEGAVSAALAYVARTRCALAFAPLEDIAGEVDQPNLPGTTEEHPNWRRRMADAELLRVKRARAHVRAFVAARREP